MKTWILQELRASFGSVRTALILFGLLMLSRCADIATTYRFLASSDWDYSNEANSIHPLLWKAIGFWPESFLNIVVSLVFFGLLVWVYRKTVECEIGKRATQKSCCALLCGASAAFFLVAIHNLTLFPDRLLPELTRYSYFLGIAAIFFIITIPTTWAAWRWREKTPS